MARCMGFRTHARTQDLESELLEARQHLRHLTDQKRQVAAVRARRTFVHAPFRGTLPPSLPCMCVHVYVHALAK